jgi:CubicO group peptidase (beta-lactamase class C family)
MKFHIMISEHALARTIGATIAALTIVSASVGADSLYFPPASGSWTRVDPASVGWDVTALDAALEYARTSHSSSVVILLNGRILAEREWDVDGPARYTRMRIGKTGDGRVIEDVASAQKSLVAFLAGVAEGRGKLDLSAPVDRYLGPGWSKADRSAESAITVRHLMTMTSGLNDSLVYLQPAGDVWRYNTGAYSRMIGVLEKAQGTDIQTFTHDALTAPTGMTDSRWLPRPWSAGNDAANAIGLATTGRDLARFGLLILADGKWAGNDLVRNPNYLRRMITPSQDLNPSYGLLWWLNGQLRFQSAGATASKPGSLIPAAPRDLVAALGALDRKCYIVPSRGLVVTRLGDQTGEAFDNEFWKLLTNAMPSQNPVGR